MSQVQHMQRVIDWLVVRIWPGYAEKWIGCRDSCIASLLPHAASVLAPARPDGNEKITRMRGAWLGRLFCTRGARPSTPCRQPINATLHLAGQAQPYALNQSDLSVAGADATACAHGALCAWVGRVSKWTDQVKAAESSSRFQAFSRISAGASRRPGAVPCEQELVTAGGEEATRAMVEY